MARWHLGRQSRQVFVVAGSASIAVLLLFILIALVGYITVRGAGHFWPDDIVKLTYRTNPADAARQVFAVAQHDNKHDQEKSYWHFYFFNAASSDVELLWLNAEQVVRIEQQQEIALLNMQDGSRIFAQLSHLQSPARKKISTDDFLKVQNQVGVLQQRIDNLRQGEIAEIHAQLAQLDELGVEHNAPARLKAEQRFFALQVELRELQSRQDRFLLHILTAEGQPLTLRLAEVKGKYWPNNMDFADKVHFALSAMWVFVSEPPGKNNASGGVFPALFGTVLMVLLMTVLVTPLGVLAAVYLYEYAPQNQLTALIRISVSNLAGIPSVVYGVFGLGFFVHTLGGSLDRLFFDEALPMATFGKPGLFWASLTMALLTLPVVIVATEEGLRRVPVELRKASYALGATQTETIVRIVLPVASPGIMTGIILAIARGAGEVAPLILVGAVKFAPALPIDGDFPYIHLQRQFMHLGVLIYDGAFHGQNIGSGSPFIFAVCMLLLLVVFVLNLLAVGLRNRLRRQYGRN